MKSAYNLPPRASLAVAAALTVACTLVRPVHSIQEQCGVIPASKVTRSQAVCIATFAGLEPGPMPWDVWWEPQSDGVPEHWSVASTFDSDQCAQRIVFVARIGGAVLRDTVVPGACDFPVGTELPKSSDGR